MTGAADLRVEQSCPGWCDGNDHAAAASAVGSEDARHFTIAGEHRQMYVAIVKPLEPGWPKMVVTVCRDDQMVELPFDSAEARWLAASLTRAADLIDFSR